MARRPGNELLFAARVSRGWFSQEAATEGVTAAGRSALRDSGFAVTVRTYRRWESDSPGWPRPDYATAIRAAFGRGPEHLGFSPPTALEVDSPAAAREIIPDVNRRTFATGVAAGMSAGLPWMTPSPASATAPTDVRVGHAEIAQLKEAARDLDAIDQRSGGDRLWRSARLQLWWLSHLVNTGQFSAEIEEELQRLIGQLTTSLGWFCYDADLQPEARMYYSEALNTAMLSDDEKLATRTLSNMARQSVDLPKPREAVRYARLAEQHAAAWSAPPRVTAMLAIRAAQGYARMRDEMNTSTAIKRAWRAFDQGKSDRDPEWVGFLNEARAGLPRRDVPVRPRTAQTRRTAP